MIERLLPQVQPAPKVEGNPPRPPRGNFSDWLEAPAREVGPGPEATKQEGAMVGEVASPDGLSVGDAIVQFHFRQGQGGLEVVSLPWRLAASGTLSQRAGSEIETASAVLEITRSELPSAPFGLVPEVSLHGIVAPALVPETDNVTHPPLANRRVIAGGVDGDTGPLSLSGGAPEITAMPWLVRLVRWLQQKGHDPAVWVRDYRLGQAETTELVATLRAHAREQGVQLERVVVNGHELWSAATTHQMEAQ